MFAMLLEIITSLMIFGLLIHAIKSMNQMDAAAAQSMFLRAKIENIDKTFAALLKIIERSVLEQQRQKEEAESAKKTEEKKEEKKEEVVQQVKDDSPRPTQPAAETSSKEEKTGNNEYKTSKQDD